MQDNDPEHCSRYAQRFYEEAGINWWRTPQESPDLNPIENLWREMIKPTTKQELIDGILTFWAQVDDKKVLQIYWPSKKGYSESD